MASKTIFFACALVVLVKMAASQGCGCGCGCGGGYNVPNNNQAFTVVSQSDAPSGLAVQSSNSYDGQIKLGGQLPFLGSAAVQGCAQNSGCGSICYGCGDKCSIGIRQNSCGGGCGCGCGAGGY